ncbi:hypothetical protein [Arenimonas terrae]|uniref:DUF2306 domain-containing protein n=1 Tax=Arenimonas terrae TaxID=2546226 RepID=A0A5C4RPX8_9GAMM|nr:hypothetical protein [Arenimonas terrae]TNJ33202.1 hypothetical protein E1B00_12950 [Arenimonas terrae]
MTRRTGGVYFSVTSALLLFLSVVAFSDNLFTDVGQASNHDPKFVIHGLFGLAWYVLLTVQANLIRTRRISLHRTLGIATFLVAVGVTLSTLYIFVVLWKGWANMAPEVRANRLLLPGYALCVMLAWHWRARADWHKRLLFAGTFLMLGPVLARTYDPLIASWLGPLVPAMSPQTDEALFLTYFFGVWVGFFVSLACHDWLKERRVHPATLAGFGWLLLSWLVSAMS